MPRQVETARLESIKQHALNRLTPQQVQQTNLSIDHRIYEAGEQIGPPTQRITVDEPTVVVFADDAPMANWGHPCRYLLYSADTGVLLREIPARLPSGILQPFYRPVQFPPARLSSPPEIFVPRWPRCPIILPDGNRYALLFAGFTMERHLNDLEFCYRTLVNNYAIPPENVYALSFDGTLTVVNDDWTGSSPAPAVWPGDGTPYQINLSGQGTRQGLEDAFEQLAARLGPDDLLFIHTNNHGDTDSVGSYIGYPAAFPGGASLDWLTQWVNLYASDFAGMLGTLPKYRTLMVMMEQCGSGGFNGDIMESSTASETTFAAACLAGTSSYGATYLGAPWDAFAYQWIAAMAGQYPNGAPLTSNPDTDGSYYVDAADAFNYAQADDTVPDSPNFLTSGGNAGRTGLVETFRIYWCWLLHPILTEFYEPVLAGKLSPGEFHRRLNRVLPQLQRQILPPADEAMLELRHRLTPEIRQILDRAFG